jgi:hypothetical protein
MYWERNMEGDRWGSQNIEVGLVHAQQSLEVVK